MTVQLYTLSAEQVLAIVQNAVNAALIEHDQGVAVDIDQVGFVATVLTEARAALDRCAEAVWTAREYHVTPEEPYETGGW